MENNNEIHHFGFKHNLQKKIHIKSLFITLSI